MENGFARSNKDQEEERRMGSKKVEKSWWEKKEVDRLEVKKQKKVGWRKKVDRLEVKKQKKQEKEMKTFETILKKEMKELQKIIEGAEKRLKNTPSGYLRISKKKNKVEYYLKNDVTSGNGRYLKKSEKSLAKAIAQRDYDASVLKNAKERLKVIEIFLDKYKKLA